MKKKGSALQVARRVRDELEDEVEGVIVTRSGSGRGSRLWGVPGAYLLPNASIPEANQLTSVKTSDAGCDQLAEGLSDLSLLDQASVSNVPRHLTTNEEAANSQIPNPYPLRQLTNFLSSLQLSPSSPPSTPSSLNSVLRSPTSPL